MYLPFDFINSLISTNGIPPKTCKQILFPHFKYPFTFDLCERKTWYSPSSSLQTDCMTSFLFVLPLYFLVLVSIISMTFPLRLCQVIDQQEESGFRTASNRAGSPQITSCPPLITTSGSSD